MSDLLEYVIGVALVTSLAVETSTWWLRSRAGIGSVGIFVSRTNIYLYGGRIFALIFTAGISYLIDTGTVTEKILFLCFISLVSTSVFHFLFLTGGIITHRLIFIFGDRKSVV